MMYKLGVRFCTSHCSNVWNRARLSAPFLAYHTTYLYKVTRQGLYSISRRLFTPAGVPEIKQDPTTKRLYVSGPVLNDAKLYGDAANGGEILTDAFTAATLGTLSSLEEDQPTTILHLGAFLFNVRYNLLVVISSSAANCADWGPANHTNHVCVRCTCCSFA